MQSENTNIELLRNTIDIFMDVTGYRFLVKEQFITFLLDIPWYDVYFIQVSQYVFCNLFLTKNDQTLKCLPCINSATPVRKYINDYITSKQSLHDV